MGNNFGIKFYCTVVRKHYNFSAHLFHDFLASFHMQCQAQETRVSTKVITPALGQKIKISYC